MVGGATYPTEKTTEKTMKKFIFTLLAVNNNRKVYQIVIEKYTTSMVLQKYKKFG